MQWDEDGVNVVRADLHDRLDMLQKAGAKLTMRDFVSQLATIRTIAGAYGMIPVVCLAEALERAVRNQPRGCPADIYFERLRDAVGCGPTAATVSEPMLATISLRMRA
ncbi:hypothetical protein RCO27_11315 [Sphingosinicella sp. LHD-64]|uniref:hypothetical protein n=1 Tax=Sphingosinicella sp. LHD-64 TaxID=3072139 RepID=UPI00280D7B9E|nr:hypothetical protein [Sphingosinicella sp. LHD-64]MDQ8756817.1 hypothetical protein [Sphingosinicella sp. LHD-64]